MHPGLPVARNRAIEGVGPRRCVDGDLAVTADRNRDIDESVDREGMQNRSWLVIEIETLPEGTLTVLVENAAL